MNDLIFPPDQAQSVQLGGTGVVFRLNGQVTGGSFAVVEHPLRPKTLAAPIHTHTFEDDYSYILEGEITFLLGDQLLKAKPGDWVCKPRGIPHTFWNGSPTLARILEIISPAGFEQYFQEMAVSVSNQDREQMARIREKYGLISDMASVPILCREYRLSLEGQPELLNQ